MAKRSLIVGISGTTNSGKTSIAKLLCQVFPGSTSMCQDHYFLLPGDERLELIPGRDHSNWEKLSAMDMEQMMKDVSKWKENQQANGEGSTSILFIEGFLIFNHHALAELFDKKFFLTIDKETCLWRRKGRVYNPPDPEWYFEDIVWPMYLKNLQELKNQNDICYLSGEGDQNVTVQTMRKALEQCSINLKVQSNETSVQNGKHT